MSNKKYYFLDNKEWLISERKKKSRTQLAEELGCPAGSLRWAELQLTSEVRASFIYERAPHKNNRMKR